MPRTRVASARMTRAEHLHRKYDLAGPVPSGRRAYWSRTERRKRARADRRKRGAGG